MARTAAVPLGISVLLLLLCGSASATVYSINSVFNIGQHLASCGVGDTFQFAAIEFDLSTVFTYPFSSGASSGCTWVGAGIDQTVLVTTQPSSLLQINSGVFKMYNMTIGGQTVSGGTGFTQAVTVHNSATFAAYNVKFIQNISPSVGGAVACYEQTTCSFDSSSFNGNSATSSVQASFTNVGGAVFADSATLTLTGCHFDENYAYTGGAVFVQSSNGAYTSSVTVVDTVFSNNQAIGDGGAIVITDVTALVVSGSSQFISNTADNNGGAIRCMLTTTASITGAVFASNVAFGRGGAIYADGLSTSTITACQFNSNTGGFSGGAIVGDSTTAVGAGVLPYASITVTDSVFRQNSVDAGGRAGAIDAAVMYMSIDSCIFDQNNGDSGGAIYMLRMQPLVYTTDPMTISNSVFSLNTAVQGAAMVFSNGVTSLQLVNVTATGNHATGYGGVIVLSNAQLSVLPPAVFSGNRADVYGGVLSMSTSASASLDVVSADTNAAGASGGFAYVVGSSSLSLTNSNFTNHLAGEGAVVYIADASNLVASSFNRFVDNAASSAGGVLAVVDAATVSLQNSVVVGNNATQIGGFGYFAGTSHTSLLSMAYTQNNAVAGGVHALQNTATLLDTNSTFTANSAAFGGAIFECSTAAQLSNRYPVFANNAAGVFPDYGSNPMSAEASLTVPSTLSGHPFGVSVVLVDSFGQHFTGNLFQYSFNFVVTDPSNHSVSTVKTGNFVNGVFTTDDLVIFGPAGMYGVAVRPLPLSTAQLVGMPPMCLANSASQLFTTVYVEVAPCPTGNYIDSSQNCVPVPAGAISYNDTAFTLCPPGTASNNGTKCEPCPIGYYTSIAGLKQCLLCQPNTYTFDAGATECIACPQGGNCSDPTSVQPSSDYYLFRDNATQTLVFSSCKPGHCVAGDCGSSYNGTLCGDCASGLLNWHGACVDCPPINVGPIVEFIVVYLIVATIYVFFQTFYTDIFNTVWFFLQVVTLITSIYADSNSSISTALGFLNYRPSCLGQVDYYGQFILAIFNVFFMGAAAITVLVTAAVFSAIPGSSYVLSLIQYLIDALKRNTILFFGRYRRFFFFINYVVDADLSPKRSQLVNIAFNCLLSTYLPTLSTILGLLYCQETFPGSGVFLLYQDQAINCADEKYLQYRIAAIVLAAFLLSLPLLILAVTIYLRAKNKQMQALVLFGYFQNTSIASHWAAVLLLRRAAIAAFTAFIAFSNLAVFYIVVQIFFTTLLVCHVLVWPYKNIIDNVAEVGALCALCLMFFLGPVQTTYSTPILAAVLVALFSTMAVILRLYAVVHHENVSVTISTATRFGRSLAVTRDGQFLLVGFNDGVVGGYKIIRRETNKDEATPSRSLAARQAFVELKPLRPVARKQCHKGGDDVTGVLTIGKHGRRFITYSRDQQIKLWEIQVNANADATAVNEELKLVCTFRGHRNAITSVAVDPEANICASGSSDGTVKVWNLQTCLLECEVWGSETEATDVSAVAAVCFSSDGTFLAWSSGSRVHMVPTAQMRDFKAIRSGRVRDRKAVRSLCMVELTGDDTTRPAIGTYALVAGTDGKQLHFFVREGDGLKMAALDIEPLQQKPSHQARFSKSSDMLMVVVPGQKHDDAVLRPRGESNVSDLTTASMRDDDDDGFRDDTSTVQTEPDGDEVVPVEAPFIYRFGRAFLLDERLLAAYGSDGVISIVGGMLDRFSNYIQQALGANRSDEAVPVATVRLGSDPIAAVVPTFKKSHETMMFVASGSTISMVDCLGRRLSTFLGHRSTIQAMALSPDELTLFSAGEDKTIRAFAIRSSLYRLFQRGDGLVVDTTSQLQAVSSSFELSGGMPDV